MQQTRHGKSILNTQVKYNTIKNMNNNNKVQRLFLSFYCTATTENTMTTSITIFCFHSVFIIHWQQCCNCTVSLTETQLKQNKISHPICSVKCVKCVLDHASVALHSDLFSVSDEWERVVWTGCVTLQTPQNIQVQTLQQNTIPHAHTHTHWVLTHYTTMKNENELCWWV